jgi:betaine-aldehyde dehydrogenase
MNEPEILTNWVDGSRRPAADGRDQLIVNPRTGIADRRAPLSGKSDVDAAVAAARDAFSPWRAVPVGERASAVLELADLVEKNREALAIAESGDTGKLVNAILRDELPAIVDQLRFAAGAGRVLSVPASGEYQLGLTSSVRREPVGVCGLITAWNYPLLLLVMKLGPALVTGNTVVVKPADTTPSTAGLLAAFARDALPPGVINVVCGDRTTGQELVSHDGVDLISFTGSVEAGREVAASAAKTLKRVHLELGGNAPAIVFEDADVDETVRALALAVFGNAGQDCVAGSRVLVAEAKYAEVCAGLAEQAKRWALDQDGALLSPLNNERQMRHVAGLVMQAAE